MSNEMDELQAAISLQIGKIEVLAARLDEIEVKLEATFELVHEITFTVMETARVIRDIGVLARGMKRS
jgi:tetrahydromethanopterin S-methyltransferase subunit G